MAANENGKTAPSGSFEEYGATEPIGGWQDPGKTAPASQGTGADGHGATEAYGISWNAGPTSPSPNGFQVRDFDTYSNTGDDPRMRNVPSNGGTPPTRPPTDGGFENYGPTEPSWGWDSPSGRTEPVYPGQRNGFLPVVGWLVCIEGPERGRDYRIHDGYNSIGRAQSMDICVNGDGQISREKHAVVAFDPDEGLFYFAPAEGKNLVKLNGKTLMTTGELKAYDTLTIGRSRFKFIPFCGESFSWVTGE